MKRCAAHLKIILCYALIHVFVLPAYSDIEVGREVVIQDAKSGQFGYYRLFIPKDYSADRSWPIVFCYHGLGGKPTTSPFKATLQGQHAIIVGMGYHEETYKGVRFLENKDLEIFDYMFETLSKRLSIDTSKMYVGGFSKGGWYACGFINCRPEQFAGAVILAAGKQNAAKHEPAMRGKPIFIACGDKDNKYLGHARNVADYFRSLSANVEYQQWPGVGHTMGNHDKLGQWLRGQFLNRQPTDKT